MYINKTMFDINRFLEPTDSSHSHSIDALAYAIAAEQASLPDKYILLYVKKCPRWLPVLIYKFFLARFLVLANFKKTKS